MRVRLICDCDGMDGPLPAGTVIDHADADKLVELGVAVPVEGDAANGTPPAAEAQAE